MQPLLLSSDHSTRICAGAHFSLFRWSVLFWNNSLTDKFMLNEVGETESLKLRVLLRFVKLWNCWSSEKLMLQLLGNKKSGYARDKMIRWRSKAGPVFHYGWHSIWAGQVFGWECHEARRPKQVLQSIQIYSVFFEKLIQFDEATDKKLLDSTQNFKGVRHTDVQNTRTVG